MTWLIFALSLALAAAGAISIASGVPYIQMEWGWTETIAGAVAISAGVMTFALGAILYRLTAIQRTIQNGSNSLVPSRSGLEEPVDSDQGGGSPEGADPSEPAAPVLDAEQERRWARDAHAEDRIELGRTGSPMSTVAPDASGVMAEQTETEASTGAADESPAETAEQPRASWAGRLRSRFRKGRDHTAAVPLVEPEPGLELRPTSDPAEEGATRDPDTSIGAREPAGAPEESQARDRSGSARPETPAAQSRDGISSTDLGRSRENPAVDAAAPSVVGRYEAAGVSYLLLSDGAIEVKTETGVHRFASMQDLKVFIEAQELQGAAQNG